MKVTRILVEQFRHTQLQVRVAHLTSRLNTLQRVYKHTNYERSRFETMNYSSASPVVWAHDAEVLHCREHTAFQEVASAFQQFQGGDLAFLVAEWNHLQSSHSQIKTQLTHAFEQCRVRPQQLYPVMHRQVLSHLHALELEERGIECVPFAAELATTTVKPEVRPLAARPTQLPHPTSSTVHQATRQLQAPSTAADRYRQYVDRHGGLTLGWAEEDHNIFVRVLLRQLEPRLLLETLVESLPQCSRQEVARHIELYSELGQLEHEKRVEMEAFRQQRHADAANERVLAELRQKAAEAHTKTEAEQAEHRRRLHHAAVKKRLSEMREAKQKEEEAARVVLAEEAAAAKPSTATVRRAPLVARPRNQIPPPPLPAPAAAAVPTVACRGVATSKVSLERRRMQDEEWLRRRQEQVLCRSQSAAAERKEERILEAARKLAPTVATDRSRAIGSTQATRLRASSSDQRPSTSGSATTRGSSAHSFQRAPASWCDRNHLR